MLSELVVRLEAGGTLDAAALSAGLGASPALLEAMLEHLGRLGLIQPFERSSDACSACGLKVSCGHSLEGGVRLWQSANAARTACAPEAAESGRGAGSQRTNPSV